MTSLQAVKERLARRTDPGAVAAEPNKALRDRVWLREELLHLLSLSGTLSGLCITGVTLLHTFGMSALTGTIADDILAISALLFLICTYSIFVALRSRENALAIVLEKIADTLFLLGLTGMTVSGFIMVYTVW